MNFKICKHQDEFLFTQMSYHYPASEIAHAQEKVNKVTNNSINAHNLDNIEKKVNYTLDGMR